MKTIEVCIGSACHLKGSYDVIECFRKKIKEKNLENDVELKAAFCLGNCVHSVSVKIGDQIYSVSPETAPGFFDGIVLQK